jgi:hypothetical protein
MFKTILAGIFMTGIYVIPASAEECGRWVPCKAESKLSQGDISSYIYGNRSDVEPWVAEEKKPAKTKKTQVKVQAAPQLGVSKKAEQVMIADSVARDNERRKDDLAEARNPDTPFEGEVELSIEEEAAARAYLNRVDAARAGENAPQAKTSFEAQTSTGLPNVKLIDSDED